MINLFISSILSVVYHFISGKIFCDIFNLKKKDGHFFYFIPLFGLFFLSFLSLFLNFFFPLNEFINSVTFLVILSIFLFLNKDNFEQYKDNKLIKYIIFCSVGTFLLLVFSKTYNPDGALYHFPYTNILNENKIILGVSNIHQRFGHTSIMQYLSALHYNFLFGLNGIVIPLATIAVYVIMIFIVGILREKNFNIVKAFCVLVIFFICWKMNRYNEYGNDAPGHFLFFLLVLVYLKILDKKSQDLKNNFYILCTISTFCFFNKTFLILSILIPILTWYQFKIKELINLKYLFILFFVFCWLIKNLLTTGCLIYPIPKTCLNFQWTNFLYESNISDVAIGSEAWAKDWSNQKNNILSYDEYLKNFYWVKFWLKNHFIEILKKVIPFLFIIITFILIVKIKFRLKNKNIKLKNNFKKYVSLFLILLFSILIWFLKAPIYRYGYSYFISAICLFFAIIIQNQFSSLNKYSIKKISLIVVCLAITILSFKQITRISKNILLDYNNYPWPKYFSYSANNDKVKLKKIFKNKVFLYYIPKKNYCFYSKSPCTSVGVDEKIKTKYNNFGYKVYYF